MRKIIDLIGATKERLQHFACCRTTGVNNTLPTLPLYRDVM